ncbi:MAG: uroporphyrin-3 C-methyltransferase [Paraglaciecola psychrophila]|jgi:uroporphyrin-3 C-methyltransferase
MDETLHNDKQQQLDDGTANNAQRANTIEPPALIPLNTGTLRSGPGWWLWALAMLLALAAAAGSGYLWQLDELQRQQHSQQQSQQSQALAAAQQQLQQQSQAVAQLQATLQRGAASSQQRLERLQQQLRAQDLQLSSLQKRLLSLSITDRADWLLAEAEYLMRLANQRLLMGKELGGARDLLAAADAIVLELDDSALYPVRAALADNMAALAAAGNFDLEGRYLRLQALADRAAQLRLFKQPVFAPPAPEVVTEQGWQQGAERGLQAALTKLNGYISYQLRDQSYRPAVAPDQEVAVRQNLQLMFEQAQLALLAGKQSFYMQSLQRAQAFLERYYSVDEVAVTAISGAIDELLQTPIERQLPDISSSPRALKSYLQRLHAAPPAPPQSPAPEPGQ